MVELKRNSLRRLERVGVPNHSVSCVPKWNWTKLFIPAKRPGPPMLIPLMVHLSQPIHLGLAHGHCYSRSQHNQLQAMLDFKKKSKKNQSRAGDPKPYLVGRLGSSGAGFGETSDEECSLDGQLFLSANPQASAILMSSFAMSLENSSWLYTMLLLPPNSSGSASRSKCILMSSILSSFFG